MENKLGAWQVGDGSDKEKEAFNLFFPKGYYVYKILIMIF